MLTDNGKEFSGHKDLATVLGINGYFAPPYHSWERGANEKGAAEPIPPDSNLSRYRNDKSHLDFFASEPKHEVDKPAKISSKNKKSGAEGILLGGEDTKEVVFWGKRVPLFECKHRGKNFHMRFRPDFAQVERS